MDSEETIMNPQNATLADASVLGHHNGEQRQYWDDKTADDINLLAGEEDDLYHLHYGIGDFDRSVLDAPTAVRDELIQRELHRMETKQVDLILEALDGLPAGSRGMDAGSGRGGTSFRIAQKLGHRMDGVNFCAHHIEFAEGVARKRGWDKNVSFHFANMVNTPFEDGTFDFVVSNETTMYADLGSSTPRSRVYCARAAVTSRPSGAAMTWSTPAPRRHG